MKASLFVLSGGTFVLTFVPTDPPPFSPASHPRLLSLKILFSFFFNFQHVRPASHTRHLNCQWLHHDNPYLRLGPFKFEVHHTNPQVAELHDFISENMTDKVKDEARGKMKATPYVVGDKEEAYSKLRTSKVMYMNEKRVTLMMNVSNRIEKATRYRLTHEQYASENFQVMNYGIGGTINGHLDSSGM